MSTTSHASRHTFSVGRRRSIGGRSKNEEQVEENRDNDACLRGGGGKGGRARGSDDAGAERGEQENPNGSAAKLIAVIADEDTVTGMLLAGVGAQLY